LIQDVSKSAGADYFSPGSVLNQHQDTELELIYSGYFVLIETQIGLYPISPLGNISYRTD
jgi:hypothetical protein